MRAAPLRGCGHGTRFGAVMLQQIERNSSAFIQGDNLAVKRYYRPELLRTSPLPFTFSVGQHIAY
jgi:hypothetical protein